MDQKGHGIAREHFEMDSTVTDHFRHSNLKYLVMSDSTLQHTASFRHISPYLEPFFTSGSVKVWKLKPDF
jgi:hypothetical protein